jgi:hypothetical protein
MITKGRLLALLLVAALGCAATSSGQQKPSSPFAPQVRQRVKIRGVDLDEIDEHLNRLRVVGREERGNSFRELTPALGRGDRTVATVDPELLRARRLAMYEGGEVSHDFPSADTVEPAPVSGAAGESPREPRSTPTWRWVLLGLFLATTLALAVAVLGPRLRDRMRRAER